MWELPGSIIDNVFEDNTFKSDIYKKLLHNSQKKVIMYQSNNATVNRIIEVWSLKSYFLSMTNKKCTEIHFTAFISLAHDNFTLKIAKKILRYTICNLMTLLPLSIGNFKDQHLSCRYQQQFRNDLAIPLFLLHGVIFEFSC